MERVTNENIAEWQDSLRKGDFFFYYSLELENCSIVWGEVLEDQEELEYFKFRYCKVFTYNSPQGITGYVSVSVIHQRVSKDTFELAKKFGFPHDEPTFLRFAEHCQNLRITN